MSEPENTLQKPCWSKVMVKKILFDAPGSSHVLRLVDAEAAPLKPDDVQIKLHAAGLNYIDIYHRTGLYPVLKADRNEPSGLGLEGAGVVMATGAGVSRFQIGDRVGFCSGPIGAYAEVHNVPERNLIRLPDSVSFDTAAAVLLKGLTAEFLIRRMRPIGPGSTILFHAAAGGVGLIACAWAKALGATVIGTVGSVEKAQLAQAHGCDHIILYRTENIPERVKALTNGKGCDVVFDSVGQDTLFASLDSCARRGLVVSFGNASGPPPAVAPSELAKRGSLFLSRPTLFDYVSTPEELAQAASALFDALEQRIIEPHIAQVYRLEDAQRAHDNLEARSTTGSSIFKLA
jgi:NADPH:quinone reductase